MTRTIPSMIALALAALPSAAHAGDADPPAQTVTVSANKDPIVRKLDKTVHDVAAMPRAANGSAQDILQATPDVAVTADGRIAVKGNTQVTVLVDGKPTALLSGSDEERAVALQTMSGADVASVEVVTNPSAAQNAGGGAIVNIVLKRNRKPGAHGEVRASATDQGLWNAGASGDVTRARLSVHGSVTVRHDGTLKIRRSDVDWRDPVTGLSGQTRQASEVFVRRIVDGAGLGVDYALSDTDSIGLTARDDRRRSRPLFDVFNDDRADVGTTRYHRISEGPNEQADDSASLGYTGRHDGAAVKATVSHSATHALVDKSYRDVFVDPARATAYSHGATRTARRLDQATVDWTRAAPHGQWGAGVDVRRKTDDIGNYQANIDPASGRPTPDPATTNGYTVTTTVSAAYLTDRIHHGRWEALLGGRAERMALRIGAGGAGSAARWQAVDPSLHLKYAHNDDTDLTLSYRRSLQIPDPRDLNPFTTYVDAHDVTRGNPDLRPQRVASWEIGADTHTGHVDGNVSAFYRTSRDTVVDARSVAADVLIASKRNGGQARSAGMTAALDWTPVAALRFGVDAGAYRVALDTPDLDVLVRQHDVAGYANLRAAYGAGRDDVSLDAHAQSAGIAPLGRFGPTSSVNLTWKHALSKTSSLTVNANDIFDGSLRTWRTSTATFRQVASEHFVARRIYVGFVRKID